jgi:hypothetical protein
MVDELLSTLQIVWSEDHSSDFLREDNEKFRWQAAGRDPRAGYVYFDLRERSIGESSGISA